MGRSPYSGRPEFFVKGEDRTRWREIENRVEQQKASIAELIPKVNLLKLFFVNSPVLMGTIQIVYDCPEEQVQPEVSKLKIHAVNPAMAHFMGTLNNPPLI